MSANSSRGRDPRCPAWTTWVITVAFAVVGGLAASAVGPRHLSLTAAVAVSLIIGVGTAVIAGRRNAVTTSAARTPVARALAARALAEAASDEHQPPADSSAQPAAADMLRVLPGQAAVTWWDAARQELPPTVSAGLAAPPELASYLDTAQVAQCPNCGELTLDATGVSGGWALECPACSHAWTWRPGTPWPDVTVIPRRRRASGQSPASSKTGNSRGSAGGPQTQWRQ